MRVKSHIPFGRTPTENRVVFFRSEQSRFAEELCSAKKTEILINLEYMSSQANAV
jgi:hypothetical protein